MEYNVGDKVEVLGHEKGFIDSYYAAKILNKRTRRSYLIKYETLLNDDGHTPVNEVVTIAMLRPEPPHPRRTFSKGDIVDVYENDGWWVGEVVATIGGHHSVYFREYDEEEIFTPEQMRVHFNWTSGRWIAS